MKRYRALIKPANDWWIGWLIDLPGVDAQERTREECIESLRQGAMEMLSLSAPFKPGGMPR